MTVPLDKLPVALGSIQVDVTTRLGAATATTPTGLQVLDRMLAGGLRHGTLLTIAGGAGSGKTAFALLLAYMAARARAAVVYVSATLDETDVVARLAARALHREQPDSRTSYGAIWSGEAFRDEAARRPATQAIDTAVKKVGSMFHLFRPAALASTDTLAQAAAQLWGRHERVLIVIDGAEAFTAHAGGDAARAAAVNSSLDARVAQVAYELRALADHGCAVVATFQSRSAELASPAATFSTELKPLASSVSTPMTDRLLALGARPVDLVVTKNTHGPTGIVPLRFIAGAATFEERAP